VEWSTVGAVVGSRRAVRKRKRSFSKLCIESHHLFCCVFCRNDEDADDDDVSPEHKAVREKLRRQQNNARERYCRKWDTCMLNVKL